MRRISHHRISRRVWRRSIGAFVILALSISATAGTDSATAADAEQVATATTTATPAAATVGALWTSASANDHSCTASVVDSPAGDVLITAAHCITGTGAGMQFAPGYRNGQTPYGTWQVTGAYGAAGWIDQGDSHDDFAFLTVAPKTIDGRTVQIQDVTGGNALGRAPKSGEEVAVTAYNSGVDDEAITCSTSVFDSIGYPGFSCDGYVGGSSGSPWLAAAPGGGKQVVGVIGGRYQGGCTSATSYSAPFGATLGEVYQEAASGAAPSTFPTPGPNGCMTII